MGIVLFGKVTEAAKKAANKAKNAAEKVAKKSQDLFLPSPEVSEARRLDTFGTTSKAVVGGIIVASAAVAIAAPAILGGSAVLKGLQTIPKSLASAFAKAGTTTKVASLIAAPVVAGAVISDPKVVTRSVGGLVNVEKNLYKLGNQPSLENAANLVKENPVIAGAAAALGLAAVGGGGGALIASVISTKATKENTAAILASDNSMPSGVVLPSSSIPQSAGSLVPLTPETQVLGKPAGSKAVARRSGYRPRAKAASQQFRINIVNQSRLSSSRRTSYYS